MINCNQIKLLQPDKDLYLKIEDPFAIEIKISNWKKGLGIYNKWEGNWVSSFYSPNITLIDRKQRTKRSVQDFCGLIPEEIREQASTVGFCQLRLLRLVRASLRAADLLESNKILLWMIVCHDYENQLSQVQINKILSLTQTRILNTVFGNGSQVAAKFLKKIQCKCLEERHYRILKKAMKDDNLINLLRHQPVIPINLIPTLQQFEMLLNPGVITFWVDKALRNNSSCHAEAAEFAKYWTECRLAGRVLRLDQMDRSLQNCRTPKELISLRNNWDLKKQNSVNYLTAKRNVEQEELKISRQFSDNLLKRANQTRKTKNSTPEQQSEQKSQIRPFQNQTHPIAGNDNIQPVLLSELKTESVYMKNCINTFKKRIQKGTIILYRMLSPRATIEIRRTKRGLSLGMIRLRCNRKPNDELKREIRTWFLENKP
jgi:hypothetical protein